MKMDFIRSVVIILLVDHFTTSYSVSINVFYSFQNLVHQPSV